MLSTWRSSLKLNSFQTRLMFSAILSILLILPVVAMLLNTAFTEQLKTAINNELAAHSYSILAVAEIDDNTLAMPALLLDNLFNVSESGLYAIISQNSMSLAPKTQISESRLKNTPVDAKPAPIVLAPQQDVVWASPSLLSLELPKSLPSPELGQSAFSEISLAQRPHFIYSFSASFELVDGEYPLTVHIVKDKSDFDQAINRFKLNMWFWFGVLLVVLVFVQLVWLTYTLAPLKTLLHELVQVEQGDAEHVQKAYPDELDKVARQVNTLLSSEQQQRQRYRNALSDLAHALKTPLAVIQTQQDLTSTTQQQLAVVNKTIEHQLKRAQSAGDKAWHVGLDIGDVADKIIASLDKIYRQKQITFSSQITPKSQFKGDESDLYELLGNLLDNACKACQSEIKLTVHCAKQQLSIMVEDDGSGISEQERERIFHRGTRADTYDAGHGIGLAIVRDLVDSYQGQLEIGESKSLGGACFHLHFNS
ncbi:ATP-binding protein [Thalassotalea aquiviva]|uniref:ATP-binding protein n=1 Tax=Thalassotalea aquiviva TaxID=3242415 RepID=UPI00352B9743